MYLISIENVIFFALKTANNGPFRAPTGGKGRVTMKIQDKSSDFSGTSRVTMEIQDKSLEASGIDLSSVSSHSSRTPKSQLRPMLGIKILDLQGTALIDTAAKKSVAGSSLYKLLLERGHPSIETTMRVKLADGSAQWRQVHTTTLQVDVGRGKCIELDFVILPDAVDNETLLGIDFLVAAGLVLDFGTSTWKFSGESEVFAIQYESLNRPTSCYAAEMLREDEGKMLTVDERRLVSKWEQMRETAEKQQERRKQDADQHRQPASTYQVGDEVLVTTHLLSSATKGRTRKLMPKRDGPYRISRVVSATTYDLAHLGSNEHVGRFHSNDLTPFHKTGQASAPIQTRRHRGHPRLNLEPGTTSSKSSTGRTYDLEGEHVARTAPSDAVEGTHGTDAVRSRANDRSASVRRRPIRRPARYRE
ncbi:hypothetical protein ACJJTC_018203 [Scirpophaga incertulas]